MVSVLSVFALIFSIGGNVLINVKNRIGYIVWILSNVLWIMVNCLGHLNVSQVIMYVIYAGLNIQGFINWSRKMKVEVKK